MKQRVCLCGTNTSSDPCQLCGRRIDTRAAPLLPPDLDQLNAHQRAATIEWYANLPLNELRRRQGLAELQLAGAYARRLASKTLHNLQVNQQLLAAAVDKREFQ